MHFKSRRVHINKSLKKIGVNHKLQPSLRKEELEDDEIYEDFWEEKENDWLSCLKNDVLSTASSYARYSKCMEKITGFGMKNSKILPSLANGYFNSLRDERDAPIHTYNEEYMRYFVRQ